AGPGAATNDRAIPRKDQASDKLAPTSAALVIEVLGPPALLRLYGDRQEPDRCYRLREEDKARLLTLSELKARVTELLKAQPPLGRIELVLYKDSPERRTPRVTELRRWLDDLGPTPTGKL